MYVVVISNLSFVNFFFNVLYLSIGVLVLVLFICLYETFVYVTPQWSPLLLLFLLHGFAPGEEDSPKSPDTQISTKHTWCKRKKGFFPSNYYTIGGLKKNPEVYTTVDFTKIQAAEVFHYCGFTLHSQDSIWQYVYFTRNKFPWIDHARMLIGFQWGVRLEREERLWPWKVYLSETNKT
jgi:hypothetical protein